MMKRRHFISLTGATLLAGCNSGSESEPRESDTPTQSPTPIETPTHTETPFPTPTPTETATPTPELDLTHFHGITGRTYPPDKEGNHHRRYEWSAIGYDWWYEINIPRRLGEYYKNRYGRSENYDVYVSDPYGNAIIKRMADGFERMKNENDLTQREVVDLAVAFVQSMNYTEDEVTSGFNQYTYYPVETLIERGGDCEDSTILLAAILRQMGYDCVLLGLWDVEPEAHMALGVRGDESVRGTYYTHNGDRYYYVETTGDGYRIGEMPDWEGSTSAEIIEIDNHPTLVYEFETSVERGQGVNVDATIWNYGQRAGHQTSFYGEFADRSGEVYANDETQIGPIDNEEQKTASFELHPPDDRELRLNTAVLIDDSIHDLVKSEWRKPV